MKKAALFFLTGIGFVFSILAILSFFNSNNFGVIKGKVVDENGKAISGQIVKVDGNEEVITDKSGNFFIGSLEPGKHSLYIEESLLKKPVLENIKIKKGGRKRIILRTEKINLASGIDFLPDNDLITAAESWGRYRNLLYYYNSAIIANMLSPFSAKLAYRIKDNNKSYQDKIFDLVAFEQQDFYHRDDVVPSNPNKKYTNNDIWGYFLNNNGVKEIIMPIETPEAALSFQNIYNKKIFGCEGFAFFNAAMMRLLGLGIDEVFSVNLRGEVGHVITLARSPDGFFMFSNNYLYKEGGESVEGESKNFGRFTAESQFKFSDNGIEAFVNDYYNVFTPEAIIDNADPEKIKDFYNILEILTGEKIPLISNATGKYQKGHEPTTGIDSFISNYKKKDSLFKPITVKTALYKDWVQFLNALKEQVWAYSRDNPDYPYTFAKYNRHSLFVRKPEIYAKTSLRGVILEKTIYNFKNKSTAEIMAWIKENINKNVYTEPTQIMIADEAIIFQSGRPQDKALLAFSILKFNNVNSEIIIGVKGSYLLLEKNSQKEIWDMGKLERIEKIPEEPLIVFNDEKVYYPAQNRDDVLPIDFRSFVAVNNNYFTTNIPSEIGKKIPFWSISSFWGAVGLVIFITSSFLIIKEKRGEKQ